MQTHTLPGYFTPHEASGRAKTGSGGMGPVFALPEVFPCFVVDETKLVRDSGGAEVVSSTQVHCNFGVVMPPGSLVTVWPGLPHEREAEVISSERAAHETLPAYQTLNLA